LGVGWGVESVRLFSIEQAVAQQLVVIVQALVFCKQMRSVRLSDSRHFAERNGA
jgi:Ran GTPase-activating protein (RanGAP) involved in mRNA processing and transport